MGEKPKKKTKSKTRKEKGKTEEKRSKRRSERRKSQTRAEKRRNQSRIRGATGLGRTDCMRLAASHCDEKGAQTKTAEHEKRSDCKDKKENKENYRERRCRLQWW